MKKAVIITPFDNYSYNVRIKYLERYLQEQGYVCTVISADFDHRNKQHYDVKRENLELLHVPEYRRNLSFSRIYSHFKFAKLIYIRLKEIAPDLVYGSAPPNFLFSFIAKYKKQNNSSKLIFEIGDLWPETLPLSDKFKMIFAIPLRIWAGLRNRNLKNVDFIIYECELFRNTLHKYHPIVKSETIYLAKENFYTNTEVEYSVSDGFNVAYVGSINNIVDIDGIIKILVKLNKIKNVVFHIIGDGERKTLLLNSCIEQAISYVDHGIVYEDINKKEILKNCQFGLNIMKSSVVVGVTMKSLEYFHWGMILINNIPADTEYIVSKYNCGFNILHINENELDKLATDVSKLDDGQLIQMRQNSREVFCQLFDERIIHQKYTSILSTLEKQNEYEK